MTLEDKNESYAGGFAAGLGNDADDGTAGGSGGGVTTGGNAFSSGFGCSVNSLTSICLRAGTKNSRPVGFYSRNSTKSTVNPNTTIPQI
jgi:hypothetical protein